MRDVRTGSTFDTSYRPEEKFEQAIIETVPAQYLYKMDDTAYFMNTETYDQYEIPVVNVENELLYILENSDVKIQFYGTEVIGVTVPTTVELTVAETQPSIKGATVTGSGKPATMETGLVVNVPDFIEAGQKLVINTAESVSDTLSKLSLGRGVYLKNVDEELTADIYLYLEYGVKVPKVAVAIQKAVKDAVRNMADVELTAINIHVAGIVPDKTPKPELKDLFDEDFLND